jgi:HPt (histidine-containing phosphotransfer) domain-containing protein
MPRGSSTTLGRDDALTRAATTLRPRFLERRRRDVASIRAALECGDFETIDRLGHNLRGNGLSFGFPEMSAIGERLEVAAVAKNAIAVLEELALLETCLLRIDA